MLPVPGGLLVSLARWELSGRVALLEARVKKLEAIVYARLKADADAAKVS